MKDFVNEVKDYIHGRHKLSLSQRGEARALKNTELVTAQKSAAWRQLKVDEGKRKAKTKAKKKQKFVGLHRLTQTQARERISTNKSRPKRLKILFIYEFI